MSTPTDLNGTASRRERRAAKRRAAKASGHAAAPTRGRSPFLWITLAVGGLGIVALVGLVLFGGGATRADTTGLVTPSQPTPTTLADGRTIGKPGAPVTLELWSDFQCPICGEFARTVEPQLIATYVTPGTLRIVHHDAAFQGARSGSAYDELVESAAGARCAADQALYWPYQDWVFANQSGENQGAFANARLRSIATAARLDVTAWDACRTTGQQQAAVRDETNQAVANGVNATPTMTINGHSIVGLRTAAELGQLIEAAAAAAGG